MSGCDVCCNVQLKRSFQYVLRIVHPLPFFFIFLCRSVWFPSADLWCLVSYMVASHRRTDLGLGRTFFKGFTWKVFYQENCVVMREMNL